MASSPSRLKDRVNVSVTDVLGEQSSSSSNGIALSARAVVDVPLIREMVSLEACTLRRTRVGAYRQHLYSVNVL